MFCVDKHQSNDSGSFHIIKLIASWCECCHFHSINSFDVRVCVCVWYVHLCVVHSHNALVMRQLKSIRDVRKWEFIRIGWVFAIDTRNAWYDFCECIPSLLNSVFGALLSLHSFYIFAVTHSERCNEPTALKYHGNEYWSRCSNKWERWHCGIFNNALIYFRIYGFFIKLISNWIEKVRRPSLKFHRGICQQILASDFAMRH